jgi:hypothetical protein
MKRLGKVIWRLVLRFLALFDRLPAEDCITFTPMQQYMLDSEAEWQVAYLEYCWQLDATKHYHEK